MIKITIAIPTYNQSEYLDKCLNSIFRQNYPLTKYEVIVVDDCSTDNTHQIVLDFIDANPEYNIQLLQVSTRGGKTNAQNEAVSSAEGEIIIFSDANAILDKSAVKHLLSSFSSDDIMYVSGRLVYSNSGVSITSNSESSYWNYDLFLRKMESSIQTITGGNGSLYAVRLKDYVHMSANKSHDTNFPAYAALHKKKALYNELALSYEKAGEVATDEYKRKKRMCRSSFTKIFKVPERYNIFKCGWYSYFYFWHRAMRNLLHLLHILLFIC